MPIKLNRMSSYEKEDMIHNLLLKYPRGLSIKELLEKSPVGKRSTLEKILKGLLDKNRVELIRFGEAKVFRAKY